MITIICFAMAYVILRVSLLEPEQNNTNPFAGLDEEALDELIERALIRAQLGYVEK